MKLEDARKAYYEYSAKASELTRNLGFAAVAIAWLFKSGDTAAKAVVPPQLFNGAKWAISALVIDFAQYALGAAIWSGFSRIKETHGTGTDSDFKAPSMINYPAIFCFWLKIVLISLSYVMYILPYLYKIP